MEDFSNMVADMIAALEQDMLPPKELYPVLNEEFPKFPIELQMLLVDKEVVQRQVCEVWSRVMGYFRPVNQWNGGKKQEHKDRLHLSGNLNS